MLKGSGDTEIRRAGVSRCAGVGSQRVNASAGSVQQGNTGHRIGATPVDESASNPFLPSSVRRRARLGARWVSPMPRHPSRSRLTMEP